MDEGGDQADRVELREFIRHVCSVPELEQEEEVTTDFVQTIDSSGINILEDKQPLKWGHKLGLAYSD